MHSKIFKFEIWGAVFTVFFGSLLHFTFELFNKFWLVGMFSAINESTWEHLKLAVMPAILWLILERKVFKLKANNFYFAKFVGIYLMPILIIVLFYGYKAVLGTHNLFLDILIFILAVVFGHLISCRIMTMPEFSQRYNVLAISLLILLVILFFAFTFYPPRIFLFQDPRLTT